MAKTLSDVFNAILGKNSPIIDLENYDDSHSHSRGKGSAKIDISRRPDQVLIAKVQEAYTQLIDTYETYFHTMPARVFYPEVITIDVLDEKFAHSLQSYFSRGAMDGRHQASIIQQAIEEVTLGPNVATQDMVRVFILYPTDNKEESTAKVVGVLDDYSDPESLINVRFEVGYRDLSEDELNEVRSRKSIKEEAGSRQSYARLTVEEGESYDHHELKDDVTIIGSKNHPGKSCITVNNEFVSSEHLYLGRDGADIFVVDKNSTNGSWLKQPGSSVFTRLQPQARVSLEDKAEIRLVSSDENTGSAKGTVSLTIHKIQQEQVSTPLHDGTPLWNQGGTPLHGSLEVIAQLHWRSNLSEGQIGVTRLPFTIGRSSASDFQVPGDHKAVSRDHLVIKDIDEHWGVYVESHGSRGSFYRGEKMEGNQDVGVDFGTELFLGGKRLESEYHPIAIRIVNIGNGEGE